MNKTKENTKSKQGQKAKQTDNYYTLPYLGEDRGWSLGTAAGVAGVGWWLGRVWVCGLVSGNAFQKGNKFFSFSFFFFLFFLFFFLLTFSPSFLPRSSSLASSFSESFIFLFLLSVLSVLSFFFLFLLLFNLQSSFLSSFHSSFLSFLSLSLSSQNISDPASQRMDEAILKRALGGGISDEEDDDDDREEETVSVEDDDSLVATDYRLQLKPFDASEIKAIQDSSMVLEELPSLPDLPEALPELPDLPFSTDDAEEPSPAPHSRYEPSSAVQRTAPVGLPFGSSAPADSVQPGRRRLRKGNDSTFAAVHPAAPAHPPVPAPVQTSAKQQASTVCI